MKMITPQTRQGARRLMTVQIFAGLALLALAMPYSGCTTASMWDDKGPIEVQPTYTGRCEFNGDSERRVTGDTGAIAYPGTMKILRGKAPPETAKGWLIIPAEKAPSWEKMISKSKTYPVHTMVDGAMIPTGESALTISPNNHGSYEFQNLPFRAESDESDLETQWWRKAVDSKHLAQEPGSKTSNGTRIIVTFNVPTDFSIKRPLNTGAKIIMTPATLAVDAVGGAVVITFLVITAPAR